MNKRARLVLACLCACLFACTAPAALAADLAGGQRLFVLRCASCHAVGPSARAGFGPQLNAVIGRRAGSTPDFHYSPAMVKSNIVWNEKTLAAFLDSPSDFMPGTKMRFWGMSDRKQVGDLLAYLRSIPPAPAR
jgi:cytochrome c